MKYDLFVSDYDGTFGVGENIDEKSVSAVKEFIARGGKFAICSGRPYSSIKGICNKYNLKVLTATCQGSEIRDVSDDKKIFMGGVEYKEANKIAERFLSDGFGVVAFIEDVLYYQGYSLYAEYYKKLDAVPKVQVENLPEFILREKKPVQKLVFRTDDEVVKSLREKYSEIFPDTKFNSGGEGLVEAVSPNFGKGFAVKFLADYYKIPLTKVIAMGDYNNDMELVTGSWHGVAVGDGQQELKDVADEVTVPYKDNPVKFILDKYCLQ